MRNVLAVSILFLLVFSFNAFPIDLPPEIRFPSTDGTILSAHRFGDGPDWVILAHMFPTDQSSWYSLAGTLASKGYSALTFDFRGYGGSQGVKEIYKIDRDLAAAVHFAQANGARRMVLIGASMGGTAALKVAASEPVAGVIALSPPMTFFGLSSEEALPKIRVPKLFLVSAEEMNVSVRLVRNQFKATPDPKEMEIVPGAA
ncbi:MAG TPA: alpha/beta fold hydrolase, partial [Nitrospiria bacterium]|nr:alpha/beta fold hydrolase [Nitrospiria bacterium]